MDLERMANHWLVRKHGVKFAKRYACVWFSTMYAFYGLASLWIWRILLAEQDELAKWKVALAAVLWLAGLGLLTRMFFKTLKAYRLLEMHLT